MARIRPAKGQTSGQGDGPGGAPPPDDKGKGKGKDPAQGQQGPPPPQGKKRKSQERRPSARPRPTPGAKTEKAGSVTKGVQENRTTRFFGEVVAELRKVTWPTREQLLQATAVVLLFVAVVTIYLWIVDGLMSRLVDAIF